MSKEAIEDWEEDAQELQWHLNHLRDRSARQKERILLGAPRRLLRALDREIESLSRRVAANNHPQSPLLAEERHVRELYRYLACAETSESWHSPPLNITLPLESLLPLSIIPGYNDYERGFVAYSKQFADWFCDSYYGNLAGAKKSLLFSSGMGAIQTLLQTISNSNTAIVMGRRVYYETRGMVFNNGGHSFGPIHFFDEANQEEDYLKAQIERADALFVDTVGLDSNGIRPDLNRLFSLIERQDRAGYTIVLDNTVPGPELSLPTLPPRTNLFIIESLLKYYQGGFDLGSAGILTLHSRYENPQLFNKLEITRAVNGTNINPLNAHLLPYMPVSMVEKRLRRHHRNARLFAEKLSDVCPLTVLGCGGLIFVETPRPDLVLEIVGLLALSRNLCLMQGTSFGFNRTRVCVPPQSSGMLRIACGMEDCRLAGDLADCLRVALVMANLEEAAEIVPSMSRFFPDFPERMQPGNGELDKFNHFLREFGQTANDIYGAACELKSLAPR